MDIQTILQKAWRTLWQYRALWLFGVILALFGANAIYPDPWLGWRDNDQWIKIKITETATIQFPGADMTIDLTAPEGLRVIIPDGTAWDEFRDSVDELNREEGINLRPILIEFAMMLISFLLVGVIARYITETAVIRMVNETEETGKHLGLWQGLRKGMSLRAWRLFLVDLTVGVLIALAFIVVFGLAAAPLLLVIGSHEAITITAGVGALGLLVLASYLWLAASAILSLVMQTIRRACVLEDQSLLASVRQGVTITKYYLKDVTQLWLIWMSIRLLWVPLAALIVILLAPVLLLAILTGLIVGSVPATLVSLIANLFVGDVTAVIMGLLAALPFFIVVVVSPMLFVSGLVEIYKSNMWTLAYRELRTMEHPVRVHAPQTGQVSAHGSAD